jgi:hypothetical protein
MNPGLTRDEQDALLEILERGLVRIRLLAASGDTERAEAVADALHNVPRLLWEGQRWGWTIGHFRELFLLPLVERFPEFDGLQEPLNRIDRRS